MTANQRYNASEKGKATHAAYRAVNKDKTAQRVERWRTENPELCRAAGKKWRTANSETYRTIKHKKHARRCRALGFNPLNSPFVGCDGHHINLTDVIYIPKDLHVSAPHNVFTGKGMAEMNALAGAFLTEDWT